jgi:hypothetical protein
MSSYTCCRGPDPATRCAPMEPLVHELHRTLRDPKSTWSLSIPVIKKWKEKKMSRLFFKSSTIHLGSFSYSIRKLSAGGWFAKKWKNNYIISGTPFACNLCNRLREERPKAIRKTADRVLTCSTQTLVVRIWFFKSYKNTRKEKERNRIYIRRHTHTQKGPRPPTIFTIYLDTRAGKERKVSDRYCQHPKLLPDK